MYQERVNQNIEIKEAAYPFAVYVDEREEGIKKELEALLQNLATNSEWYERKIAAQKIGRMRYADAIPGLANALDNDPFWLVRCAVIQALAAIGDPRAIPALRKAEKDDRFQIVKSCASAVVKSLNSD